MKNTILLALVMCVSIVAGAKTLNFDQPTDDQAFFEDGIKWAWTNQSDMISTDDAYRGTGHAISYESGNRLMADKMFDLKHIWVKTDNGTEIASLKIIGYSSDRQPVYTQDLQPIAHHGSYMKVELDWKNITGFGFAFETYEEGMQASIKYDEMRYSIETNEPLAMLQAHEGDVVKPVVENIGEFDKVGGFTPSIYPNPVSRSGNTVVYVRGLDASAMDNEIKVVVYSQSGTPIRTYIESGVGYSTSFTILEDVRLRPGMYNVEVSYGAESKVIALMVN